MWKLRPSDLCDLLRVMQLISDTQYWHYSPSLLTALYSGALSSDRGEDRCGSISVTSG